MPKCEMKLRDAQARQACRFPGSFGMAALPCVAPRLTPFCRGHIDNGSKKVVHLSHERTHRIDGFLKIPVFRVGEFQLDDPFHPALAQNGRHADE